MGLILLSINVKVGIVGIIGYILIGFGVPYISSSFGKEAVFNIEKPSEKQILIF